MSTTVKFALLLFGAAVLALAARALFANIAKQPVPADQMVQIRAAAIPLPAGLLLRADDLGWIAVDKTKLPQHALVKGSREAETLAGALIRHDTAADAPILANDIIRSDAPGFLAAALKPGMRAVSVPVDNVSGNAGLIQPGDYVDMILVQESRSRDDLDSGRAHSVVSETVVEKVRVIAVGSVLQAQGEAEDAKSKRQPARTVTIEVMPRAAEAVTVAARLGTLSMALRSFAVTDRTPAQDTPVQSIVAWDNTQPKSAPVWASDVSRALATRSPPKKAEADPEPSQTLPYEITVMRGAKRDTQTLGGSAG
ncbi:Flp pilus assembly protein CpaB [Alcaligenaceae bacterium CGII-47]|nr:Flp pilus assembly protein CpaB [Alcaligenaceae bacterium CGII-47]